MAQAQKNQGTKNQASTPATQEPKLTPEERKAQKAEKFVRLATKRTSNALKAMRLVRQLSNRGVYSYTPEQVAKVTKALEDELAAIKSAFSTNKENGERDSFSL